MSDNEEKLITPKIMAMVVMFSCKMKQMIIDTGSKKILNIGKRVHVSH